MNVTLSHYVVRSYYKRTGKLASSSEYYSYEAAKHSADFVNDCLKTQRAVIIPFFE